MNSQRSMAPENPIMEPQEEKLDRIQKKVNKLKAFYALTKSSGLEKCATTPVDPTSRSPNSSIEIQPKKPQVIPPKELEHLRARLRAQQKEKLSRPLLYQTFIPELLHASNVRQLLLYALIGGDASGLKPEWCTLVRWQKLSQVVVFAIEGMTQADWEDYSVVSPALKNFLDVGGRLEPQDETALSRNLLEYPLSNRSLKRIGRLSNGDVESRGDQPDSDHLSPQMASPSLPVSSTGICGDPRMHYLMSVERMAMEKYPLPNFSTGGMDIKHYVPTKDSYNSVTGFSRLFAVDCEMCMTSTRRHELTRISIVSETLEVVYDAFVKPFNPILNYLTKYSGITKAILDPVTTRLHDVQEAVRKLLPADAILCGQSLNGDLHALEMIHPYVIDTSVVFNLSGNPRAKTSLKILSQFFLGKSIQGTEKCGHDSIEDSRATMELVLLKLRHGISFGDVTRGWEIPLRTEIRPTDVAFPTDLPSAVVSTDFAPVLRSALPNGKVEFPLKRKLEGREGPTPDPSTPTLQLWESLLNCVSRGDKSAFIGGISDYFGTLAQGNGKAVVLHLAKTKKVLKAVGENLLNHEFVFAELTLTKDGDETRRKDRVSSLMRRVFELFAGANDKALCLVVLSGDSSVDAPQFGLCCATVKNSGKFSSLASTVDGPVSDPD